MKGKIVSESEMEKIRDDVALNRSIKRGLADSKSRRERFIDAGEIENAGISALAKKVDRRKKTGRKPVVKKLG